MKRWPLIFVFLLASCGAPGTRDIVSQYQNTARTIGITPVYPPEEWLQVGDIFVQSVPKTKGGLSVRQNPNDRVQLLFGSSESFLKEAEAFMSSRVAFLRTKPKPAKDALETQPDIFSGTFRTRALLDVETLPIVAFPEVTADAGTNLGFSLVRLFQAIGIGAGQRTQVILNFNDVRKYGIPKLSGFAAANKGAIADYTAKASDTLGGQINLVAAVNNLHASVDEYIRQELVQETQRLRLVGARGGPLTPLEDRCKRFLVITEVYVTRQITYTFRNAQILALAAERLSKENADTASSATGGPTPAQTNIVLNGVFPKAADGQATSPVAIVDPAAFQTAVSTSLANQTGVGEGLVFNTFTARGAEFRQQFERPVVIGFEAIPVGFPTPRLLLEPNSNEGNFETCLIE